MWLELDGRTAVKARSGGVCEVHGGHDGAEFSHRKARSQRGLWSPTNGLWVCQAAHRWFHAQPIQARQGGWVIPSWDDPDAVPVWLAVPYAGWFRIAWLIGEHPTASNHVLIPYDGPPPTHTPPRS